jgi:hypothetical protein
MVGGVLASLSSTDQLSLLRLTVPFLSAAEKGNGYARGDGERPTFLTGFRRSAGVNRGSGCGLFPAYREETPGQALAAEGRSSWNFSIR